MDITRESIVNYIDHTNVKPDATRDEIKSLCSEAIEHGFHSVCVSPYRVKAAREFLGAESRVALISVIGFPYGFSRTEVKVQEALWAVTDGATEIDMVVNIGALKEGDWGFVKSDITKVAEAISPVGLKVIVEVGFLTEEELFRISQVVKEAGAKFVKTSTGYGPRPAQVGDIEVMRRAVGEDFGIKASGGIRDYETAVAMIEAGATRVGTSAGVKIIGKEDREAVADLSGSNE